MSDTNLVPYLHLMRSALSGNISLEEFALSFPRRFEIETAHFDKVTFSVLHGVFLDSDEYVPSDSELLPQLRAINPDLVIDDPEFIERIGEALRKLAGFEHSDEVARER